MESIEKYEDPREGIPEIVRLLKKLISYSNIPIRHEFAEHADFNYLRKLCEASHNDQRTGKTWDEKIYYKQETVNGLVIHIYGI